MKIIKLFVFSILLYSQGSCKNVLSQNKVVGGHPVPTIHTAPFIVSIQVYTGFGFSHGCAGAICGNSHVITAGHCLAGHKLEHVLILVGTVELKEEHTHPYQGKYFRVEEFKLHDKYGPPENDIGIIKIRGEFNTCGKSGPKRIGMSLTETKEGTNCTIYGWGFIRTPYSHENPIMPNALRSAVIPITNYETCKHQYVSVDPDYNVTYVTKGTMCAGYSGGDKATCYGDSGGPLVCNSRLEGLVSFGSRKCGEKPGVFTSVLEHLPWISKQGCTLCSP